MKRLKYLLFLLVFFMIPNVSAIKLTDINLVDKSEGVTITDEPKVEGLVMDVNAKFSGLNDYVKYDVTVYNDGNSKYVLDEETIEFAKSEYFEYSYEVDKKELDIKDSTKVTFTIKYIKEVPRNLYVNGVYRDSNSLAIMFVNNTENPNTGDNIVKNIILFAISVLGIIAIVLLIKKTKRAGYIALLLALIPVSITMVKAIEKIKITINTNLMIEITEFCTFDYGWNTMPLAAVKEENYNSYDMHITELKCYEYKDGMTWQEYMDSDYNKCDDGKCLDYIPNIKLPVDKINDNNFNGEDASWLYDECTDDNCSIENFKIIDKSKVYYTRIEMDN